MTRSKKQEARSKKVSIFLLSLRAASEAIPIFVIARYEAISDWWGSSQSHFHAKTGFLLPYCNEIAALRSATFAMTSIFSVIARSDSDEAISVGWGSSQSYFHTKIPSLLSQRHEIAAFRYAPLAMTKIPQPRPIFNLQSSIFNWSSPRG